MVSGILVLIGKIAFLFALYGFMLVVYRGLLTETRRAGQPASARRDPSARPSVERWELRPPTSDQPAVRAVAPPRVAVAPPVVATPEAPPATVAAAAAGAVAGAAAAAGVSPPAEAPAEPAPAPVVPAMLRETAPPATPAPEPAQRAALVVLTAPEAGLDSGQRLPLSEVMRLGRADDNHIILRDRFVSSHHAEISREAGGYVLRDLGSTNGTFRNGARLDKSVVLQEGDRIGIGTSMFTFHSR